MTLVETLSKADEKIDRLERRIAALHALLLISVMFLLHGQRYEPIEVLALVALGHFGAVWAEGQGFAVPGSATVADAAQWLWNF